MSLVRTLADLDALYARVRQPFELPTVGQILEDITAGEFDGEAHDAAYPERVRQTIY